MFWRLPLIRSIEPPSAGVCRCQVFGAMAGEEVEAAVALEEARRTELRLNDER